MRDALVVVAVALASSLVSAVLVSAVLVLLPASYFERRGERSPAPPRHPVWRILILVVKNFLGVLLVTVGVVMIFTPGQGILTILLGLVLVDFPGKYRLERALIARPRVFHAINALRDRFGRPPFGAEPGPPS